MSQGDNKCAACGQFAGRGHRCPTTAPPTPHTELATPTNTSSNQQRDEIDSRVERAQAHLDAAATQHDSPATPQAKVHAALKSLSLTEYRTVSEIAHVADMPPVAAASALNALVRDGYLKSENQLNPTLGAGAYRTVYRIYRRKYLN